jgi:serine/threonine protein kinase
VLDFGIAKIQQPEGVRDHDITAPNLVIGTPQYMSPEQCSQTSPIDARSDVYSLGVIIYEMLSGRVPFTGESPTVIMMKQVQDPPPSILDARPDLPASVDKLIERALAKQPADRFQTAGELSEALTNAAAEMGAGASAVIMPPVNETASNAPVDVTVDDPDEVTVVQPRDEVTAVSRRGRQLHIPTGSNQQVSAQGGSADLKPWRIMVPAAIVLVVVFGIVFLLTRGAGPTPSGEINGQAPGQSGLVSDPNGQPVQPTGTPTGESERGIQPSSTASPLTPNPNATPSATQVAPSVLTGDFGTNSNDNTSARAKSSPNQRESPTPKPTAADESEPPPPPKASPSARTLPKPTTTPPTP